MSGPAADIPRAAAAAAEDTHGATRTPSKRRHADWAEQVANQRRNEIKKRPRKRIRRKEENETARGSTPSGATATFRDIFSRFLSLHAAVSFIEC